MRELARPLLERRPVSPTPVDVLRRRVRRRRQRSRAVASVAAVALLAGALIVAALLGGERSVHTTTVPTTISAVPPDTPAVGAMHLWSPSAGYAVNGLGLYVTDDGGAHWRNIAPADTYDPIGHMTAIDARDPQHIWTSWALNSHPITNYRTTDGGRTWLTDARCDNAVCPSFTAIDFVDDDHGWSVVGSDDGTGSGRLYVSSDGGAHWTTIGPVPFNGQVRYLDTRRGWGRTGPHALGANGGYTNPGGELFRTDDGGRTWTRAHPLRESRGAVTYGVPRFFGPAGVVAAWIHRPRGPRKVEILSTDDGGESWRPRSAPASPRARQYTGDPDFPVSPSTPGDVTYYPGGRLYSTSDAGKHWTQVTPSPAWARVDTLDFVTPEFGWATVFADVPHCGATAPAACTYPVLVSTSDGGRTWTVLSPG
ncbi:MAG TPA: hypothetical protein VFC99_14510 [Acidimicrobiia bacterium]|nr:hypothetical protein [Acidimicrobiia bacterium]